METPQIAELNDPDPQPGKQSQSIFPPDVGELLLDPTDSVDGSSFQNPFTIPMVPATIGNSIVNSSWVFAEMILSACRLHMSKTSELDQTAHSFLVQRLAPAAVNLIGALAGLQTFIYGSVSV